MALQSLLQKSRGLLLPLVLLAAWQWASGRGASAAYVFVPLTTVFDSLLRLLSSGELWLHVHTSVQRTLIGLGVGSLIGISVGTLMAQSRIAERLIGPLYHSMRQVPLLGMIPLLGLWVGNGNSAKLLVIVLAAFYPTVLNTSEGIRHVEKRFREVGHLLTLGRVQTFLKILLPAALPSIVTGFSHALAFSWLACMGAELLFSAGPGLGAMLLNGEVTGQMEQVLLAVLLIGLLAQGMNALFNRLARLLVRGHSV